MKGNLEMMDRIKEYFIITIGFILASIGVQYFYVPSNITGGGITGISMAISHYIPSLPMGMLMMAMNVVLFIIGFIFIGGNFGAKTIYASFGISGAMWFIEKVFRPQKLTNDILLSVIIGTLMVGTGLGIVFSQNASTGGTDIIAKILNKYFHIDMGKAMQAVDVLVVIFAGITFGISSALYAFICVILNGIIIDKIIEGFSSVKAVTVYSNNCDMIREYIINEINRGCSIFEAEGGYTNEKRKLVYSVMDRAQLIKLRAFIRKNYPDAFIIVNTAHEVLGQGFQNIQ